MIDYSITFLENIAPVSVVSISGATLDPMMIHFVCAQSLRARVLKVL
jgi:hypothetical protein